MYPSNASLWLTPMTLLYRFIAWFLSQSHPTLVSMRHLQAVQGQCYPYALWLPIRLPCEPTRDGLQVLEQIKAFAAEALIPEDRRFHCPRQQCSGVFDMVPGHAARQPTHQCMYCKHHMCIRCKTPWHEGVTCDQNMEDPSTQQVLSMAMKAGWARCPKCRQTISKTKVTELCVIDHVHADLPSSKAFCADHLWACCGSILSNRPFLQRCSLRDPSHA